MMMDDDDIYIYILCILSVVVVFWGGVDGPTKKN